MSIPSPVLILGARSDIGRAIAHAYAAEGCDVILAARRVGDLERDRSDLMVRYPVKAELAEFDVLDASPDAFLASLGTQPATVVMVVGLLGEHERSLVDDAEATRVMNTNYVGPARYLLAAARMLEARGGGAIIGVSSVAGDRGRGSNFIYGSAKAGLTAFLSGLRNHLAKKNVQVLTIKPGFVATRMTAGMKLPPLLTTTPEDVARVVLSAQKSGRDVVYVKPIWRLIMFIIGLIPEPIFKKLSL